MALALVASPAAQSGSGSSIAVNSFTPPAGALMVAITAVGNPPGTATATTGTVTDSVGTTWVLKKRQNSTSGTGCAEVWMADAGATPGARTVTLTGSKSGVLLSVLLFTGAAPVASQTGATAGSVTTNANTLAITPTATGSYIVGSASDSVVAYTMVGATSSTLVAAFNDATNGGSYGTWRSTNTTTTTTSQTYGLTPAPANETEKVAVEVLASASAPALTASAALAGSGTLSATVTASAVLTASAALAGSGTLSATVTSTAGTSAIATLTDDFTTQDSAKWSGWATGLVDWLSTAKQVQVTCTAGYPALASVNNFSLTNSAIYAQLVQTPNVGNGSTEAFLQVSDFANANNALSIGVNNGSLVLRQTVAGTNSDTTVAYNATSMKWLRFRHDGTNVYWETSPDASTWTVRRSKAPPITITKMIVRLIAGYFGTETAPGAAIFDNVNVNPGGPVSTTAVLTGSGALTATTTSTGGGAPTGTLPAKIVAGYLEGWSSVGNVPTLAKEGPAILPRDVNSNYNALIMAFGTVAANGTVTFAPDQNVANLKTDIAAWKAAGKVFILSIGGAGGNASLLDTATRQNNFLTSVKAIIDAYGFGGIDWDIEVGGTAPTPSVPGMTAITNNLIATYGSGFRITMAPYDQTEAFYLQLAAAIINNLTWVGYQFYNLDANPTAASIKSKIASWLSAVPGMTAAQFMVGFMTTQDDYLGLRFPYNQLVSTFNTVEAAYPALRGSFVWGINEDWSENYQYATTIAPAVYAPAATAVVSAALGGAGTLKATVAVAAAFGGVGTLTAATGATYRRGVASSGGEFGSGNLPGTYDVDYHYDRAQSLTYLASRGIKTTRLAFLWERLQRTLGGALDVGEVGRIKTYLDAAAAVGIGVILDCHNYARYNGVALGAAGGPTAANLSDLWTRIHTQWGSHAAVVGYGLMNEPHDLAGGWTAASLYQGFESGVGGWQVEGTNTAAVSTVQHQTGAQSLVGTKAITATGNQNIRFNDANGNTRSLTGPSISAWVYVPVTTGMSSVTAKLQLQDANFAYQTGGTANVTPGQWTQVTYTPSAALLASCRAMALQVDANWTTATGTMTVYVDQIEQGAVQSAAQAWEAASQACVTALRGAGATKTILVAGYNYSGVQSWATSHPTGWITDSSNNFLYEGHHYWDGDHSGDYPDTYATEVASAVGQGYAAGANADALITRTLAEINAWISWLTTNNAKGYVGEFGWPQGTADSTSWNTLASAWYARVDTAGLWATQWATGEWWGSYILSVYSNDANGFIGATTTASAILEAHLSASVGPPTAGLSGSGTLTVTTSAVQGNARTLAVALSGPGSLTIALTPRVAATVALAGAGVLHAATPTGNMTPAFLYTCGSGAWVQVTPTRL